MLPDSSGRTLARNLAIAHSHPTWMVTRWLQQLGREQTVQLLQCNNRCAGWCLAWTWWVHPTCTCVHPTSARAEDCIASLAVAATLPCCNTLCCNRPRQPTPYCTPWATILASVQKLIVFDNFVAQPAT